MHTFSSRISLVLVIAVVLASCTSSDAAEPSVATTSTTTASSTAPESSTTAPPPEPTVTTAMRDEVNELVTFEHDGFDRRYHLFVPRSSDGAAPLVIDLHGTASTPDDQDRLSDMRAKAAVEGFIVAQPAGLFRVWDIITGDGDDVAFIEAVVADVQSRAPVDPNRIYATGMSAGGGMAERLACVSGDLFAAVAPVAGWYVPVVECSDDSPVPVLAFHGTADFVVPYDGTGPLFAPVEEWAAEWAVRNGCGTPPEETRISPDVVAFTWPGCNADLRLVSVEGGGHGWPGTNDELFALVTTDTIVATDLIWEFFAAHPKP